MDETIPDPIPQAEIVCAVGSALNRATCFKVDVPNLVTYIDRTPTFECCVVKCGFKSRHQTHMSLKGNGLSAQNLSTILDTIVNINGGHM